MSNRKNNILKSLSILGIIFLGASFRFFLANGTIDWGFTFGISLSMKLMSGNVLLVQTDTIGLILLLISNSWQIGAMESIARKGILCVLIASLTVRIINIAIFIGGLDFYVMFNFGIIIAFYEIFRLKLWDKESAKKFSYDD